MNTYNCRKLFLTKIKWLKIAEYLKMPEMPKMSKTTLPPRNRPTAKDEKDQPRHGETARSQPASPTRPAGDPRRCFQWSPGTDQPRKTTKDQPRHGKTAHNQPLSPTRPAGDPGGNFEKPKNRPTAKNNKRPAATRRNRAQPAPVANTPSPRPRGEFMNKKQQEPDQPQHTSNTSRKTTNARTRKRPALNPPS